MRRIPLILAILALVVGLGLVVLVFANGDRAPAHDASFMPGSAAVALPSETASPSPSPSPSPTATSTPQPTRSPTRTATVRPKTPYKFPVVGKASYARTHHDYPASDIMAPCGAQIVSPVNGVVLEVTLVDTWNTRVNSGATRGGLSWSILGDDGVRYYGSHASSIEKAVRAGARVTAGQKIAKVGDTGDASACHLHFGVSPVCQRTGDWWIRRGVVWPWSYLDAWRAGAAKSALAAVQAWQAKNGCPRKPLTNP